MKAGREHRVPLSDPALVIVERLDAVAPEASSARPRSDRSLQPVAAVWRS
jgi:hypothetical protein